MADAEAAPDLKCVVLGSPGVGKTSLIVSYHTGLFPYENIPHVISKYTKGVNYQKWNPTLCIWDTASGTEHDKMRPLAYPGAHVVVICYSTVDVDTFYDVARRVVVQWWPEVYYKAYSVPIILVGTKTDVRMNTSYDHPHVTYEQGKQMADEIGARYFIEVSALTHENRDSVFEHVAECAYQAPAKNTYRGDDDDDCCTGCLVI